MFLQFQPHRRGGYYYGTGLPRGRCLPGHNPQNTLALEVGGLRYALEKHITEYGSLPSLFSYQGRICNFSPNVTLSV